MNSAQLSGEFESINEDLKKKLSRQFCLKNKSINDNLWKCLCFLWVRHGLAVSFV